MEIFDPQEVSTDELVGRIETLLSDREIFLGGDVEEVRVQLAGLFGELSEIQRNAVASFMVEALRSRLRADGPLDTLVTNILELVDPYLLSSDFEAEAQILVDQAFRKSDWATRDFDELASIAMALVNLNYVEAGSAAIWNDFHRRFQSDEKRRAEATEVALAGLSNVSVAAFGAVLLAEPFSDGLSDVFEVYIPGLIRLDGRSAVAKLVTKFVASVPPGRTTSLRKVAEYRGIEFEDRSLRPVPAIETPLELERARIRLEAEKNEATSRLGRAAIAAAQVAIKIIYSKYVEDDIVEDLQNDIIQLVNRLDPNAHSKETDNFVELASENVLPMPLIYAFPTYLTVNKERSGYSVFPFGVHRRLGVVIARNSLLSSANAPLKTLSDLLNAMHRHEGGSLYCLKNWAMAEIVQEGIQQDPTTMKDPKLLGIIEALPPSPKGGAYIPKEIETMGHLRNIRASAFVFDLASISEVTKQISGQKTRNRGQGSGWLHGAQVLEIEHDLEIQVGIGLNLYAAEWAMTERRWVELKALADGLASNTDFVAAMQRIGVEMVGPQNQSISASTPQRPVLVKK